LLAPFFTNFYGEIMPFAKGVIMKGKKPSFAFLFTAACLSVTVLSISTLSIAYLRRLRRISYAQVEAATKEIASNTSNQVKAVVASHAALLDHSAPVDSGALGRYFAAMQASLDNALSLYAANN
jgi:hypothetical protein